MFTRAATPCGIYGGGPKPPIRFAPALSLRLPFVATEASTSGLACRVPTTCGDGDPHQTVGKSRHLQNNVSELAYYSSRRGLRCRIIGAVRRRVSKRARRWLPGLYITTMRDESGSIQCRHAHPSSNDRRKSRDYTGIGFRAPTLAFALSLSCRVVGMRDAGFWPIRSFRGSNEGY